MTETVKTTLTIRLPPELKRDLEGEAAERGKTTSNYVEYLLACRLHDEDGTFTLQDLRERILQLELDNEKLIEQLNVHANEDVYTAEMRDRVGAYVELQNDNKVLRQKLYEADVYAKSLLQQRDALVKVQSKPIPHWMSDEGYKLFLTYLTKLKAAYPKQSEERLLLMALKIVCHNEDSFFMHTIRTFLDSHPHFFTPKPSIQ